MWHIDARQYAAENGTFTACYFGLPYEKTIKLA